MHAPPVPPDPAVRRHRSAVGLAARWHGTDSPEAVAARQELRHAAIAADIREALSGNLLTAEQRQSLAALLTGSQR